MALTFLQNPAAASDRLSLQCGQQQSRPAWQGAETHPSNSKMPGTFQPPAFAVDCISGRQLTRSELGPFLLHGGRTVGRKRLLDLGEHGLGRRRTGARAGTGGDRTFAPGRPALRTGEPEALHQR